MPQVMTKITTVYTLAELKELNDGSYESALESVKTWDTSGDWCTWLTDDLNQWFKDGPSNDEGECPLDSGEMLEWEADRRCVTFKWAVELQEYMRRNKLHLKYRALYYFSTHYSDYSLGGKSGTGYNRNNRFEFMPDDVDGELQWDIECYGGRPAHVALLSGQADKVMEHIAANVEAVQRKLEKWVYDEWMYRGSDEFAIEEAEAQELVFTASGRIYHG